MEAEIVTGTLRQHYFAATVASVRAGETSGAVIVLHDITDLRKLERVRRDFVANVSHEFRTPLTAIQGFAETLIGGAIDDPQNRGRFLAIILEHSRRLARLTEDLLRLSQMDAEQLELEIRAVSVPQLIESCYETAQRRAAEKDLSLSLNVPSQLPEIAADNRRLQEVLQNLLDNAIQYTLPGGKIVLSAEARGDEVIFTVADTGIGIPKPTSPEFSSASIAWMWRVPAKRAAQVSACPSPSIWWKRKADAFGSKAKSGSAPNSILRFRSSIRNGWPCAMLPLLPSPGLSVGIPPSN